LETAREKAIKLIKDLPSDSSLREIIEQLKFMDMNNGSVSAEAETDPELKKMIADSRIAYKTKDFFTTQQFLKEVSNRFSNE
jgi:hypothetical protein